MADPIVVTVTRGGMVESVHRGVVAIGDADGRMVLALGEIERLVFPRSAIKALQAIPLVESGAASAFGLDDRELAVACASHGGEPDHLATVRGLLEKIGLDAGALACGPHWPLCDQAARALARSGQGPEPIHNNCSGKHAGMLALAVHLGLDPRGYEAPSHPVQARVRDAIATMTGAILDDDICAVDGCSAPTWAAPVSALAVAMVRLGTGGGLPAARAEACARLRRACASEPWHVAGTGRFCTGVMSQLGERVFVKGGAEGVYCGALPELGLGIALKIADGARRAAECAMATVLAGVLPGAKDATGAFVAPPIVNWRGRTVGRIAAAPSLLDALSTFQ